MKNYFKIILGTFCMAAATNTVFQPFGIVTGGFSGLGIILWSIFRIPLWAANTILNVPFFYRGLPAEKQEIFLEYLVWGCYAVIFSGSAAKILFFSTGFLC